LVVEGHDDQIALSAILSAASSEIDTALRNHCFAVDVLGGGTNLSYKLGLLRSQICAYHVFLDDDAAGKTGFQVARDSGLLDHTDVHFATTLGKPESELEDWYVPSVYEQVVQRKFGVSLLAPEFSSAKKWSARMMAVFKRQGKPWDEKVAAEVKLAVAQAVSANPTAAILPIAQSAVDALRDRIIGRLQEIAASRNA
jgi:putative ATP-dependent endonuclease of the OLD family